MQLSMKKSRCDGREAQRHMHVLFSFHCRTVSLRIRSHASWCSENPCPWGTGSRERAWGLEPPSAAAPGPQALPDMRAPCAEVLPIRQFGFCTPRISQGRLSNQFMFSELFKCTLCLHDGWLWPPLNHPSFPGVLFFSPSKINIKRSLKNTAREIGNSHFFFFSQQILMKSSNPDGMNNSTSVWGLTEMWVRGPVEGRVAEQNAHGPWSHGLGPDSRWAAMSVVVSGKSPRRSVLWCWKMRLDCLAFRLMWSLEVGI